MTTTLTLAAVIARLEALEAANKALTAKVETLECENAALFDALTTEAGANALYAYKKALVEKQVSADALIEADARFDAYSQGLTLSAEFKTSMMLHAVQRSDEAVKAFISAKGALICGGLGRFV